MGDIIKITQALLEFGKTIDPKELFPTVIPEAAEFALKDPYAFCIATCLDRGAKAENIWTIPYDIYKKLGHLNPFIIQRMSEDDLRNLFNQLPRKPRFINDAPRTIKELTDIVVNNCGGNASKIWEGKKASSVKKTFLSIHGVGNGISNMAILLIEKAFGIHFSDLDRPKMDIKPDIQTKKVLFRLGMAYDQTEEDAIQAARRMHPEFPGELDAPLWIIGRKWCHPNNPNCTECSMNNVCQKIGLNDLEVEIMEIILIACSRSKLAGGETGSQYSSNLSNILSSQTYRKLLSARNELSRFIDCAPGYDLGFDHQNNDIKYLPAYKRYIGKVYTCSQLANLYPQVKSHRIIIVSALYGLLDANDLIREYNLAMDSKLPNGKKVMTWWKNQGLVKILEEYILGFNPPCVHDLLSVNYRKSLQPWPPDSIKDIVKIYNFPGLGNGANWKRGEIFKEILKSHL